MLQARGAGCGTHRTWRFRCLLGRGRFRLGSLHPLRIVAPGCTGVLCELNRTGGRSMHQARHEELRVLRRQRCMEVRSFQ